ncbi:MAG: hypothetical protein NDJ24_01880 [Alphaproteobacteria bacterium]|nr:hypothetical protein [Alphaproteobacteria bacterium]
MKIRLKETHKAALEDTGKVQLPGQRALSLYKPGNPIHDIEVQMGTIEGQRMMALYKTQKDKVIAAITEMQLDGHFQPSDIVISRTAVFNSRAEAIEALTTEGIDVGFMPLLRLSTKISGRKSPIEIIPN